ncbi:unnamed protein product [Pleuronectes platessa]|uniref:Uncharacterized protein n=1 Tax=Pleuronectes platessa TaxID=8262 RepID=A0A9N7V3C0_PLEPL|nr:unnamed protein product [Pleuronectes platessa]
MPGGSICSSLSYISVGDGGSGRGEASTRSIKLSGSQRSCTGRLSAAPGATSRPDRRSLSGPEAPLPHPIRVATALTSLHLIPASAGGKLEEEIALPHFRAELQGCRGGQPRSRPSSCQDRRWNKSPVSEVLKAIPSLVRPHLLCHGYCNNNKAKLAPGE